ncbi:MAG TPA: bifunctional demethylmenaquinone methyltransferase/2-methoxy-6-polyprenyl-1,4-benzoquinol methylase UbiE [Ignavibacteriales bacterium]|nr:bifunctional demethylmenaquinone methyltransferase/2-methoxy-6-polyprenyl-1,4-benzoquinol methylase UbiE [Ignavibacteriales bacterium]
MQKKIFVRQIFENIAKKYDFLNRLLSFGFDIYWRNKAVKLTKFNEPSKVLDIACGTGDFSIAAKKKYNLNIFAADYSINMLRLYKQKKSYIKDKLTQLVAEYLPFKQNSFDNIIVAFGVRNFYDIEKAFREFYNVLKPNGKVTILEFSLPKNIFIRALYITYFKKVLPFIGGIISGNFSAYKYLPDSVEEFDKKINLVDLLKKANFSKVEKYYFTFGIVQCIIAEK